MVHAIDVIEGRITPFTEAQWEVLEEMIELFRESVEDHLETQWVLSDRNEDVALTGKDLSTIMNNMMKRAVKAQIDDLPYPVTTCEKGWKEKMHKSGDSYYPIPKES